jgi:sec-independent protein translocase protein TatA
MADDDAPTPAPKQIEGQRVPDAPAPTPTAETDNR